MKEEGEEPLERSEDDGAESADRDDPNTDRRQESYGEEGGNESPPLGMQSHDEPSVDRDPDPRSDEELGPNL